MLTAQVLTRGTSQIVELPEELWIEASEVLVKRVGRSLLLIPKGVDPWQIFLAGLDEFTDDFMTERNQPAEQRREDGFE